MFLDENSFVSVLWDTQLGEVPVRFIVVIKCPILTGKAVKKSLRVGSSALVARKRITAVMTNSTDVVNYSIWIGGEKAIAVPPKSLIVLW